MIHWGRRPGRGQIGVLISNTGYLTSPARSWPVRWWRRARSCGRRTCSRRAGRTAVRAGPCLASKGRQSNHRRRAGRRLSVVQDVVRRRRPLPARQRQRDAGALRRVAASRAYSLILHLAPRRRGETPSPRRSVVSMPDPRRRLSRPRSRPRRSRPRKKRPRSRRRRSRPRRRCGRDPATHCNTCLPPEQTTRSLRASP